MIKKLIRSLFACDTIVLQVLFKPPAISYEFLYNGDKCNRILLTNLNYVVTSQPDYDLHCYKVMFTSHKRQYMIPLVHIAMKSQPTHVILYLHGNNSDIGTTIFGLVKLAQTYNISIVTYDPRGYGISTPMQTEEQTTYEDVEVALAFMLAHPLGYTIQQVIVWGFSLGSGAAVELASKQPTLLGLILESPLASCYFYIQKEEVDINCQDNGNVYDSYNKMSMECPILILHGKEDTVIPYRHSELLYERCMRGRIASDASIDLILIEETGHNDIKKLMSLSMTRTAKKFRSWLARLNPSIFASMFHGSMASSDSDSYSRNSDSSHDRPRKEQAKTIGQQLQLMKKSPYIFDLELQQYNMRELKRLQFVRKA